VAERFPNIGQVCREFGLDLAQDRIPVRPGAHYMIGGLTIDLDGRSTIPGLWAAGEVTSSGLHGANRLASNSLLEGLYFGRRCGELAAAAAKRQDDSYRAIPLASEWTDTQKDDEELNLADVRNSLTALMWRQVGIRRDEAGLRQAAEQAEFWDRYVGSREFNTIAGWELQNMLLVARLMIASALARTESRGVHFRTDFPTPSADLAGEHVVLSAAE
jgi:L-aspartate oxidase